MLCTKGRKLSSLSAREGWCYQGACLLVMQLYFAGQLMRTCPASTNTWCGRVRRCVPFDNRTTDVQTWISDMMVGPATHCRSTRGVPFAGVKKGW